MSGPFPILANAPVLGGLYPLGHGHTRPAPSSAPGGGGGQSASTLPGTPGPLPGDVGDPARKANSNEEARTQRVAVEDAEAAQRQAEADARQAEAEARDAEQRAQNEPPVVAESYPGGVVPHESVQPGAGWVRVGMPQRPQQQGARIRR